MGTNYARFAKVYVAVRYLILLLITVIHGLIVLWARGVQVDISAILPAAIGLVFIVMGNLLGKIRPNWFVGIRTPWTLNSKRSWVKTHRLGGWVFVLLGLLMLVGAFASPSLVGYLTGIGVAACVVALVVYSYLTWREDPDARPLGSGETDN